MIEFESCGQGGELDVGERAVSGTEHGVADELPITEIRQR
jgi:hypothetical protein